MKPIDELESTTIEALAKTLGGGEEVSDPRWIPGPDNRPRYVVLDAADYQAMQARIAVSARRFEEQRLRTEGKKVPLSEAFG